MINIPIPPSYPEGMEQVVYWEDFLSPEDISMLLNLPQWQEIQHARIGNDSSGTMDLDKRRSQVAWMIPNEETSFIWTNIINAIRTVNSKYFHFDLTACYEPAQLSLYIGSQEGHYDWHIDMSEKSVSTPRKLSLSILLSDPADFQGGELQLKVASDEIVTCEQKQGRAWFFPSYTLHRVAPVTKGVRKSLVLWVGGPPFR